MRARGIIFLVVNETSNWEEKQNIKLFHSIINTGNDE